MLMYYSFVDIGVLLGGGAENNSLITITGFKNHSAAFHTKKINIGDKILKVTNITATSLYFELVREQEICSI